MNVYEAKFAREAKEYPVDWIIAPNGGRGFKLIKIGDTDEYNKRFPDAPRNKFGVVQPNGEIK
jgi:hypothetical protein